MKFNCYIIDYCDKWLLIIKGLELYNGLWIVYVRGVYNLIFRRFIKNCWLLGGVKKLNIMVIVVFRLKVCIFG